MGKINRFLKWVFIFFNILFFDPRMCDDSCGGVGHGFPNPAFGGPEVAWIWVLAICFFGISSLGIYAACSEKSLFLNMFAGFIGVGMIVMLILGIYTAVTRNTVNNQLEQHASEIAEFIMKNNQSRAWLEILQQRGSTGPDKIYAKACKDVILREYNNNFKVIIGVFFGFGVIALMGLLISLLMIHQVKRHDGMGGLCIG